jgi:glycosyltransferase involved in cell wall biosynthesis
VRRRVFFIANGMFDNQLAGGDVHLLHSIQAVTEAGWEPEYLSTRELEQHLKAWRLPANVTFTDRGHKQSLTNLSLKGKCRLFWEFSRRFLATLGKLRRIGPEDVCFSPTDYWFDVLPTAFSKAKLKVVIMQMKAPSLKEVIWRTRADVEATRLASLHYCLSQWLSLKILRFCRQKRVVAVQPLLQATLWQMGYRPEETPLIPNGVDLETANQVGGVTKRFDVAWIGRIHRQKGVEDLLKTLQSLAREFPDFRAVLIGNLKESLAEPIAKLGLTSHVHFAGYVSGVEKFRFLKSARVYLMPSRHEGLPIVVGEALACDLPVVAYELEMYRPFFGNLLFYVKPFDRDSFCRTAVETVRKARAGEKLTNDKDLAEFKKANSWSEVGRQLVALLEQADNHKAAL